LAPHVLDLLLSHRCPSRIDEVRTHGEWGPSQRRAGCPRSRGRARLLRAAHRDGLRLAAYAIGIDRRRGRASPRAVVGASRIIDGHHRRLGPAHPPGGERPARARSTCATPRTEVDCGLPRARAAPSASATGPQCTVGPRRSSAWLAICFLRDGSAPEAWMVGKGWALASARHALPPSSTAESFGRGIWRSFMRPGNGATRPLTRRILSS